MSETLITRRGVEAGAKIELGYKTIEVLDGWTFSSQYSNSYNVIAPLDFTPVKSTWYHILVYADYIPNSNQGKDWFLMQLNLVYDSAGIWRKGNIDSPTNTYMSTGYNYDDSSGYPSCVSCIGNNSTSITDATSTEGLTIKTILSSSPYNYFSWLDNYAVKVFAINLDR